MAKAIRVNSLRDIELTRRFFNGESIRNIADSAELSTSRIQAMIESTVRRAAWHVKWSQDVNAHLKDMADKVGRKTPNQLLEIKDAVLACLEPYEKHERAKLNPVFDLDTSVECLSLPPRIHERLSGKCATVGQLIDRLNTHQGTLGIYSLGEAAITAVVDELRKHGYEKHFTFNRRDTLPEVLREVLIYMNDPASFDETKAAKLKQDVERKLELYKNYKK